MSRPRLVDPRGQRFAASLTSLVLAAALVVAPSPLALALLAAQTLVFATGVVAGPQATPYARAYARLLRPRLGPPAVAEDARPPRFAQAVGLAFGVVALAGLAAGWTAVGLTAAALALAAALLNATTGFCLGCEVYLLALRVAPARGTTTTATTSRTAPHVPQPRLHPVHDTGTGPTPAATKG